MKERLRSVPNAVDLAHAVLPQKRAQLRGHLAEAEAEFERTETERELVVLGEVDDGRPSVDRSCRLENKQVVIEAGVEFAGREADFVLRHRRLEYKVKETDARARAHTHTHTDPQVSTVTPCQLSICTHHCKSIVLRALA